MRRVLSLIVLGLVSLLVGPLAADQVVLRDGRTLQTKKPPEIRGRQAVLVLTDGKLVSVPASEIDKEKTAALARKAAEAATAPPAATPTPARPPSIAEAAQAGRTGRKATVVLTDQDVRGGWLEVDSGSPEKGEGEVVMGPVATAKGPTGWSFEGSVMNSGKAPVQGVSVTIEVIGAEGKSISTAFGQLAKDNLEPGEKATFRAQIDTDQTVERFSYVPRWKVAAPAPREGEPGAGTDEASKPAGEPTAEDGAPKAPPAPEPEPTPPPRQPDFAAPPANAPVGAPSQPGGTYLPPPSSDQPKPPGGGS